VKRIAFILLAVTAFITINAQTDPKFKYSKSLLEGKWYVVATNFPMWLDKKNSDPNFNYRISGRKTEN